MSLFVLTIPAVLLQAATSSLTTVELFAHGRTMEQFVSQVATQRDVWRRNLSEAIIAPELVERLMRVRNGLRVPRTGVLTASA